MAKLNGFKLAAQAVDRKSLIPILNQVHVACGFAVGNDLDIEVIAPCDMAPGAYNVRGEPVAVPADRADYQSLNTPELAAESAICLGDLAEMLARVEPAISHEETRYYLNGIYCEFKDGLKFTAVDGHRLLHFAPENAPGYKIDSFILPRQTVKLITGIKGGNWTLRATATRLEFREMVSGVVIRTKPIDGAFPDYHRVIPKGAFYERHTGNAKACLDVWQRFAKYGRERSKSVKVHGDSLFMCPPDIAPLESKWPIECERLMDNDSPVEIGFNAPYIRDMLAVAATDKGADFALMLTDSASPIRVDFPACPGLVGVVMPLRV